MCVAHINHRVNDYVVIKYGSAEQELFPALSSAKREVAEKT